MTSSIDSNWFINKAKEIYATLGRGYPECVYHKAFEIEMRNNGISYESEKMVPIIYKDQQVGYGRADMVIKDYDTIIEFKAMVQEPRMSEIEQLNHYMTHLQMDKGIIINFGQTSLSQRESVDSVIITKNPEGNTNVSSPTRSNEVDVNE